MIYTGYITHINVLKFHALVTNENGEEYEVTLPNSYINKEDLEYFFEGAFLTISFDDSIVVTLNKEKWTEEELENKRKEMELLFSDLGFK